MRKILIFQTILNLNRILRMQNSLPAQMLSAQKTQKIQNITITHRQLLKTVQIKMKI